MIRVTRDEYIRDTRALFQRARTERQPIEVVDETGNVRSIISLGSGEPEADPDDAGGEVYWAVCIGVVALGEWAARTQHKIDARRCGECWERGMLGSCWRHARPEPRYP